jgi:hypothetical protein
MMYENHKLCEKLKPKEICLVVEQYKEGIFEPQFHKHVPQHRLSESALQNLLRALVLKFENNEPWTIVRSHLNERGKEPPAYKMMWHVTYPERECFENTAGRIPAHGPTWSLALTSSATASSAWRAMSPSADCGDGAPNLKSRNAVSLR